MGGIRSFLGTYFNDGKCSPSKKICPPPLGFHCWQENICFLLFDIQPTFVLGARRIGIKLQKGGTNSREQKQFKFPEGRIGPWERGAENRVSPYNLSSPKCLLLWVQNFRGTRDTVSFLPYVRTLQAFSPHFSFPGGTGHAFFLTHKGIPSRSVRKGGKARLEKGTLFH